MAQPSRNPTIYVTLVNYVMKLNLLQCIDQSTDWFFTDYQKLLQKNFFLMARTVNTINQQSNWIEVCCGSSIFLQVHTFSVSNFFLHLLWSCQKLWSRLATFSVKACPFWDWSGWVVCDGFTKPITWPVKHFDPGNVIKGLYECAALHKGPCCDQPLLQQGVTVPSQELRGLAGRLDHLGHSVVVYEPPTRLQGVTHTDQREAERERERERERGGRPNSWHWLSKEHGTQLYHSKGDIGNIS